MSWFINLKTRTKLVLGFGIVILCLLTVIISATTSIADLNKTTQNIHTDNYAHTMDVLMVRVHLNAMRANVYEMVTSHDTLVLQQLDSDFDTRNQEITAIVGSFLTTEKNPEILSKIREFRDQFSIFSDVQDKTIIPMIIAGKSDEALVIQTGAQKERFSALLKIIDAIVELHNNELDAAVQNSEKQANQAIIFFSAIGLFSILVSSGMIIILTRTIALPLVSVAEAAQRGAQGDLTVEIPPDPRTDEVGILLASFRSMTENFRTSNRKVQEGVAELSSTATELMATSAETASTIQETATAIAETTATVDEVKRTVQTASTRAKSVAETAKSVSLVAQGGVRSVEENIRAMNTIRQQVNTIAEYIVRLSEQSQAIGEINGAMSDIADHANLLAVNAAIEAARSGEEGKGFTVVADEIRNLADQSKQATEKVQKILADIQKSMNSSVMAAEQGTKSVEAGIIQVDTAGRAIQSLAQSVEEGSQMATQIAAMSQQQMVGMDQIASAMGNIKEASSQNLIGVRQSEDAIRILHEIGIKLKMDVDRYRV